MNPSSHWRTTLIQPIPSIYAANPHVAAVILGGSTGRGHATMRTIYVNIMLAIGIKLAFMALVLAGLGTMWMAVAADVGTSILVTLYGMRLLNYR